MFYAKSLKDGNANTVSSPVNPGGSPPTAFRGSPELSAGADSTNDIERMARDDPLATQVWRMYARTKASLPHAQRMENLTWRMMTLALKKRNQEEESAKAKRRSESDSTMNSGDSAYAPTKPGAAGAPSSKLVVGTKAEKGVKLEEDAVNTTKPTETGKQTAEGGEEGRGRRTDKGGARVRVVGFAGQSQDGEDDEYVRSRANDVLCTNIGDNNSLSVITLWIGVL